ncbi:DoxX family protein [Pseudonocardia bannensis]|uniref:DoxX family protein n=1 Tax=Pseudonocardia bannensis TaxID=630973 RepID=A0A848DCT2_9PSEU|nr:DoxX family protein [Pseudonocardia bannensis]NMH90419.1 DoxX family protein [Pseudonocardia bannensis]
MFSALPAPARDVALLVARIVLGVILIAHGAQKFFTFGIGGTAAAFEGMGIPLPAVSAAVAATVELVGGALLILGVATAVVGLLVVLEMLGAALLVHVGNGIFIANGGWELTGAIGAAALTLAAVGPGRFSVDHALGARRDPAGAR